jgi:hypothetical protein
VTEPPKPAPPAVEGIEKAAEHFAALSKRMEELHRRLVNEERATERNLEEMEDKLDGAECEAETAREIAETYEKMLEDFNDVKRGVRTFDETLTYWNEMEAGVE